MSLTAGGVRATCRHDGGWWLVAGGEQEVSVYAAKAEGVECSRLSLVGGETTKLVDTLVKIAHQSPNDVER